MQGEVYNQSICLVIKVAKMYYSDHMSQKEISEILNISPPTVSRLLKRARDEKIIRFDKFSAWISNSIISWADRTL